MGKLRLLTAVGVTVLVGICGTAGPALAATSPSGQFCAIVGAPASGPNAASPVLGQRCFATRAAETAFARSTVAAAAALSPSLSLSPASSIHLGVAWSGFNLTGNRFDFWGSGGTCNADYYSFSNLHGPFDSAADDLASGANCQNAYWHSGPNFDGRQWDCYAYFLQTGAFQSCGSSMPPGDNGAGHSVRFRR